MDAIRSRLRNLPFFAQLGAETLNAIADVSVWQSIAGGWELFAQGAMTEALHVNLSGRLIVVRESAESGEEVARLCAQRRACRRDVDPLGRTAFGERLCLAPIRKFFPLPAPTLKN